MSRLGLFRFGWIAALLLAACTPAAQLPGDPPAGPSPAGEWTLRLTQTGGIAGVNLGVEVSSTGQLTAQNQRGGQPVSVTLPPETIRQIEALLGPLQQATPVALRSTCADCFLYRLEFTSGGTTASFEADDTTLPASGAGELVKLLQQLRDRTLRTAPQQP